MITPDDLLFSYGWGVDTFEKLVADVADEQMAAQPVDAINHPAWLLGHVTIYHTVIDHLLRGESFDNPWDAPCGKNSSPSADGSAYGTKQALVDRFRQDAQQAMATMRDASPEAWQQPMTHPTWGKQFASVAAAVTYLATTHLALHLGQLSGWRRAMALPRI